MFVTVTRQVRLMRPNAITLSLLPEGTTKHIASHNTVFLRTTIADSALTLLLKCQYFILSRVYSNDKKPAVQQLVSSEEYLSPKPRRGLL